MKNTTKAMITTTETLFTEARTQNVGGEILCRVS